MWHEMAERARILEQGQSIVGGESRKNNFVNTRIIGNNKNMTGKRGRSEKGGWLNMGKFVGGTGTVNGQKQNQKEDEHTVEVSERNEDQVEVASDKVNMMSSAGGKMTAADKEHPVGTGNVQVVRGTHANGHPVGLTGDEEDFAKKEHPWNLSLV